MKHTLTLLLIALALIVSVGKAQNKPVPATHTFTLSESHADSLMQAIQTSNAILFKKGSGISLEAAQFIGSINQSVLAAFTAQYYVWYPDLKRKADSLPKIKTQK